MSLFTKISTVFVASNVHNLANILRASTNAIFIKEIPLSENLNDNIKILDENISDIEYLLADPSFISQAMLHPRNKLKWAQSTFAGLDAIFKAVEKMQKVPEVRISRLTDGFGQIMGEYVIGHIIARERKFDVQRNLQKQKIFNFSQVAVYRSLSSLSIGILGLGTIGKEVARQCKAMNMTVWATIRDERFNQGQGHCEHVDNLVPISCLHEMLVQVDYFLSVLPSTPKTRGLLSGDVFKPCEKKKTVFINIGRGDIMDDSSLIRSLRNGWLGGAILDVFNEEPLPPSSELWDLPNVTITPHVSGVTFADKAVEFFLLNLQQYQSNQPLINEVDLSRDL